MNILLVTLLLVITPNAFGDTPDPVMHGKAQNYCDYIQQWASNGMGPLDGWASIGGVCEQMYTDNTLTELDRLRGSGDSTIWTGMYLAGQALRYMATGDAEARDEVLRIARYLHIVKEITDTPGFVARFAALDQPPWNNEYPPDHDRKNLGEGDWAGYYWIDDTSRDQYTGWWLGLTLAYEAVDDPDMRATIRADFKDVIDTLIVNNWKIVDQNGVADGNGAASVLPSLRLSWVLQAASVGADESYWELFDQLYENWYWYLLLDTFSWLNKYGQYFGFNLSHNTWLPIFRLIPDRERFEYLFQVWDMNVRQWAEWTHNAWYDSVYLAACQRRGTCNQDEMDLIADDINNTLTQFSDAPNRAFTGDPPVLPLDPFSIWWDNMEQTFPFMEDIFNVDPQTAEPHEYADRCWSDMIWQRSPYHISCSTQPDNRVGPGVDYLIAYWTAYYYGIVPGDGPIGDDDLTDDDDDSTDDDDDDNDDDNNDDNDDDNNDSGGTDDDDGKPTCTTEDEDDENDGCGG